MLLNHCWRLLSLGKVEVVSLTLVGTTQKTSQQISLRHWLDFHASLSMVGLVFQGTEGLATLHVWLLFLFQRVVVIDYLSTHGLSPALLSHFFRSVWIVYLSVV